MGVTITGANVSPDRIGSVVLFGFILMGVGMAMIEIPTVPEIIDAVEEQPELRGNYDVE